MDVERTGPRNMGHLHLLSEVCPIIMRKIAMRATRLLCFQAELMNGAKRMFPCMFACAAQNKPQIVSIGLHYTSTALL